MFGDAWNLIINTENAKVGLVMLSRARSRPLQISSRGSYVVKMDEGKNPKVMKEVAEATERTICDGRIELLQNFS